MNDSTDTKDVARRLATSLDLAAEADQTQRQEAERQRQIAEGRLLAFIDASDLDTAQLAAIMQFVKNGCQMITDESLTEQVRSLQAEVARLSNENDDLRQQNHDLGGEHTIAFPDKAERDKAEGILNLFRNGNDKLQSVNTAQNRLNAAQQQPRRPKQQGPSGPPTQQQPAPPPYTPPTKGSDPGDDQDSKPSRVKRAYRGVLDWVSGD